MGKEVTLPPVPTCCILGAGEILDYGAVARLIPPDAFLICADGGYHHCKRLGLAPHLLMGDFDSIVGGVPPGIPRIQLPVDKDYTDSAFAVEKAVELGHQQLLLTGMLGGRLDHTIANLQLLGRCASWGLSVQITDGTTDVYAVHAKEGEETQLLLAPRLNHYFSLFALHGRCESVTIEGGLYPLRQYPLDSLDPRAVSNEYTNESVVITVSGGTVAVVVTPQTVNK